MSDDGRGSALQFVSEVVADLLDIDPTRIDEDTVLFEADDSDRDLVLDSLDALKLSLAVAERYDFDDPGEMDVGRRSTVADVIDHILAKTPERSAS